MLPSQWSHGDFSRNFFRGRTGHFSSGHRNDYVYRFGEEGAEFECLTQRHPFIAGRKTCHRNPCVGFHGFFLFLFREHHSRNFTYSDSHTNSKSYANTNTDANANSNTDPQPNAYADSGAWNYRCESCCFRATGKPQL